MLDAAACKAKSVLNITVAAEGECGTETPTRNVVLRQTLPAEQRFSVFDAGDGKMAIVNLNSGLCLHAVENFGAESGRLEQRYCNGEARQRFKFTPKTYIPFPKGYTQIQTSDTPPLCWEVRQDLTIQANTCNSTLKAQWFTRSWGQIVSNYTGSLRCVDFTGAKTGNGVGLGVSDTLQGVSFTCNHVRCLISVC
jgi:hypothetical protein